jgi:hypothetical protein
MAETYSHVTGKASICVATFLSLRNWKHLIPFMMIPAKVFRKRKKKNTNKSGSDLSFYAQAFQMFKGRKSLADVAIELDIKMNGLVDIYQDLKNDFPFFYHLHRRGKKEGLDKLPAFIMVRVVQNFRGSNKPLYTFISIHQQCNDVF